MLKTNTKKAHDNIRQYIIDNCRPDNWIGYTLTKAPETWEEVRDFIIATFTDEMIKNDNRYADGSISKEKLFYEWCQGLPTALNTCYYYNRSAIDDLGAILEETDGETEKFTESQAEEKLTYLIYRELFR